jgi:hypothetical protein
VNNRVQLTRFARKFITREWDKDWPGNGRRTAAGRSSSWSQHDYFIVRRSDPCRDVNGFTSSTRSQSFVHMNQAFLILDQNPSLHESDLLSPAIRVDRDGHTI